MRLRTNKPLWILSLLAASVAAVTTEAKAAAVFSGNVYPNDAVTLTTGADCTIAGDANGSISVSGGDAFASRDMYVGYGTGLQGTMNVSTGATWSSVNLNLGYNGAGTLNISSGGKVTSASGTFGVFSYNHAKGTAHIDGDQSAWTISGPLNVGTGSLSITHGGTVSNTAGILNNGAAGAAIIDGANSQWKNSGFLMVGGSGPGKMTISRGGSVTSAGAAINESQNTNDCSVTVTGAGSTWTNKGNLKLSYYSPATPATLTIAGGGVVTSQSLDAGPGSKITMTVGDTSLLDFGTGEMKDSGGTVRLAAGAKVSAGVYRPIKAGSWTDSTCNYVSVGGIWDRTQHTFTVSSAANGSAGNAVTIDPSSTQKIVITAADGKSVGASFQSSATSSELAFTANSLNGTEFNALKITSGQEALAGWTFSATGAYTQGNPVYLSLQIGSGYSSGDLKIWHLDTNGWSDYSDKFSDLSYDGNDVSFTATGFSGYAVTGASVPEPTAMLILLPAAVLAMRRRR